MVTHHPGVGGSLYWMICFHELVPEPDVRLSIASGSPTSPYTLLYMAEIGRLCRSAGWAGHDSVVGVLAVRGWHPQSAEIYIIGVTPLAGDRPPVSPCAPFTAQGRHYLNGDIRVKCFLLRAFKGTKTVRFLMAAVYHIPLRCDSEGL